MRHGKHNFPREKTSRLIKLSTKEISKSDLGLGLLKNADASEIKTGICCRGKGESLQEKNCFKAPRDAQRMILLILIRDFIKFFLSFGRWHRATAIFKGMMASAR